jgi:uncharacterized protein (DUF169 family)
MNGKTAEAIKLKYSPVAIPFSDDKPEGAELETYPMHKISLFCTALK